MTFAWPWFLLLILAPLLAAKTGVKLTKHPTAINHPYLASLAEDSSPSPAINKRHWRLIALLIAWALLIIALARPQWVGEPVVQPLVGRSIMLSVDISESMAERDMSWNGQRIARYQAVQAIVGDFTANRAGDFIGLVVFGSFADVQAPLTPDVKAVENLLTDLLPGMAGNSTAIGDGLALAVQRLRDIDTPDKVIVLLTDGENKTGRLSPQQAANIAKQSNIRVHTIGFSRQGSSFFGDPVDSKTLSEIANLTGGQFFRATSSAELQSVFTTIDSLEPNEIAGQEYRAVHEWFYWPLSLAMLLTAFLTTSHLWLGRQVSP